MNTIDNFKVGDYIQITNLKTKSYVKVIILEFNKFFLVLKCNLSDELKIDYKKPFYKIERIDNDDEK
jgi:hypothetical protein